MHNRHINPDIEDLAARVSTRERLLFLLSHPLLHLCNSDNCFDDRIGIERHALDTVLDEKLGKRRVIGRTLAANADILFPLQTDFDDIGDEFLHGGVVFVGHAVDDARVAVEPERELGEVVGADGHAVEYFEELLGKNRVGGNLAHHHYRKTVLSPLEASLGHHFEHLPPLFERAAERHHRDDVHETHLFAYLPHRAAFEEKCLLEFRVVIARSAAPAEHRILLDRLKELAAQERAVLIALEVGEADDDLLGVERRADFCDAVGEVVHIVFEPIVPAARLFAHLELHSFGKFIVVDKRKRVYADGTRDDEFLTSEAYPVVGEEGFFKCGIGSRNVHRYLRFGLRERAELGRAHAKAQDAVKNESFGRGRIDGDELPRAQYLCRFFGAHYRGKPELTGNDGRVRGATALFGDDGGGLFHDGFPIGVGHLGDQDFPRQKRMHVADVVDDTHGTGDYLVSDRKPAHDRSALFAADVLFNLVSVATHLHRLGARLQYEKLVGATVERPLHVHGRRSTADFGVVFFDEYGRFRELDDLFVVQDEAAAVLFLVLDDLKRPRMSALGVNHLDIFFAAALADDRHGCLPKHFLCDEEFIGYHLPLHEEFAQAPCACDENDVAEARFGIEGERHSRGTQVAAHHPLDGDRERNIHVVEPFVVAVGNRACGKERPETRAHGFEYMVAAAYAEVRILLTGKGGTRQIFGSRRRADGDVNVLTVLFLHRGIRLGDLMLEFFGQRRSLYCIPDDLTRVFERMDVVPFQMREIRADKVFESRFADKFAVGTRRDDEA